MKTRDTVLKQTTDWQSARWELEPFSALATLWADTNHPDASWLLNQAGLRREDVAEWSQAEPLHQRALAIAEKSLGQDHPDVATCLNNLAESLRVMNRLVDYFKTCASLDNKQDWKVDARSLAELPFHLSCGGRDLELRELFSSLSYLDARVATGQIFEQVGDYSLIATPLSVGLAEWRDFLQKHAQRLAEYPAMLVALANHEGFPSALTQAATTDWLRPWLKTSAEPTPPSPSNQDRAKVVSLSYSFL